MFIFDKIYVISLIKKRPEKIERFKLNYPKDLGEFKIFEGVDGSLATLPDWWNQHLKGSYGCYMSHIKILDDIIENNLKNILILEDDVIFSQDFTKKINDLYNYVPGDWEQFYFGGQHLTKPTVINEKILRGNNINRTHGYVIRSAEVSRKILQHIKDKNFWQKHFPKHRYHIDYGYGLLHRTGTVKAYSPNKFLIGQAANTYSDTGSQISKVDRWW